MSALCRYASDWKKWFYNKETEAESLRADKERFISACKFALDALQEYDRLVANGDFYFNCKAHKSERAQRAIEAAMKVEKS